VEFPLVIEFDATEYHPQAKDTGRLMTITEEPNGTIGCLIQGENPVSNNLGFVTLSYEEIQPALFEQWIRPALATLKNPVFRKGAL